LEQCARPPFASDDFGLKNQLFIRLRFDDG